jgi:hypothetical protein
MSISLVGSLHYPSHCAAKRVGREPSFQRPHLITNRAPSLFWHHMSLVLLLVLCTGFSSSTAAAISGRCQPQGLLKLDKPYPEPRHVELPFCQQVRLCPSKQQLAQQMDLASHPGGNSFAVQPAACPIKLPQGLSSLVINVTICLLCVCFKQYGCSCCNASHAIALQRSSRVIAEDQDLSTDCKLGLLRLACRVCDPEVGT